jgi:hypothetical protein
MSRLCKSRAVCLTSVARGNHKDAPYDLGGGRGEAEVRHCECHNERSAHRGIHSVNTATSQALAVKLVARAVEWRTGGGRAGEDALGNISILLIPCCRPFRHVNHLRYAKRNYLPFPAFS